MRKTTLLIATLITASLSLSGCSTTNADPADTYEAFSSQMTSAFKKSIELSDKGDFFYTSEVSSGIARNTIYKDGSSVSVFDSASTTPSCPVKFDIVNSYKKDDKPIPLQAFTQAKTAVDILKSMKDFADKATDSAWIVKSDRMYMVTNAEDNINILGIILNKNGSIDYYMGITGTEDFKTTVDNVTNDNNASWNTPNVLVMYAYGDSKDIAISDALEIDFTWWLENYDALAAQDINKLAKFDAEGNLTMTPVMTGEKKVLLVEVTELGEYRFFNLEGTEYLSDGKQLVCEEGK
jgi:hypothetical protein